MTYSDLIVDEDQIVWLVDPDGFDYVRESTVERSNRYLPIKDHGGWDVVGYSTLRKDAPSLGDGYRFRRRVFWVKDYDRHTGHDCYRMGCPCEGVDPRTVAPGICGKITDRAWGREAVPS